MTTDNTSPRMILVVEDEESLAAGLVYNLAAEGYGVERAADGQAAIECCAAREFDLVILDIMLPFRDGFEVAAELRRISPQLPILMLTALNSLHDRVRGLELGADDYLTKPFHLPELLARVRGMLRRRRWYREVTLEQPVYRFGDSEIDFRDLACRVGKRRFRLTPQEAAVMRYLIDNRERIVPRSELLEKVWHLSGDVETRTVDVFIARLRRHFATDPGASHVIQSVRGAGYRFLG